MNKKILIVGMGFLGNYVLREFKNKGFNVIGTRLSINDNVMKLDITDVESVEKCVNQTNPDLIINCAANINLEFLEKNPQIGKSINAIGPRNLAKIASKNKIRLIHISTDSIFDGNNSMYTEEDIPNPINEYGKTKLLGEKYIQDSMKDYVILRTNFFGINDKGTGLLNWIIEKLSQKEEITGFDDVIFNPLEISNLSKIIVEISQSSFVGILHLSSNKLISKYEFIMKVADIFNFDKKLIKKGTLKDMNFIALRPKNTTLYNKKAEKIIKTKIQTINESLIRIKNDFKLSNSERK
jgi:dTDP-4-dehydrorhamnose reductase